MPVRSRTCVASPSARPCPSLGVADARSGGRPGALRPTRGSSRPIRPRHPQRPRREGHRHPAAGQPDLSSAGRSRRCRRRAPASPSSTAGACSPSIPPPARGPGFRGRLRCRPRPGRRPGRRGAGRRRRTGARSSSAGSFGQLERRRRRQARQARRDHRRPRLRRSRSRSSSAVKDLAVAGTKLTWPAASTLSTARPASGLAAVDATTGALDANLSIPFTEPRPGHRPPGRDHRRQP